MTTNFSQAFNGLTAIGRIYSDMPTYDYICDACGHEFEAFESITAESQTICPKCAAAKLRRKIGPGAAILFKGSGFYQTDYRSDSYKKKAEADKAPSASTDTKSTTKTDSTSSSTQSGSGSSSSNGATT